MTRVAVITGGSAGIGLAAAHRLAGAGFQLLICGRNAARLEAARLALGECCAVRQLDLSQPGRAAYLVDEALAVFGRVDVLVNNAGQALCQKLEEVTPDAFERLLHTNVSAVFHATQRVWPAMRQQGGGTIINVSSLAAVEPHPGLGLYGASKAWVNAFTRTCALEGAADGIRVYAVAPAATETRLLRDMFPNMPGSRLLSPEAVSQEIAKLCDPACRVRSGEIVSLTGPVPER